MKLNDEKVLRNLKTTLRTLVSYELAREKQSGADKDADGGRDAVIDTLAERIFASMNEREDTARKEAILHVMTLLFADQIAVAVERASKRKIVKTLKDAERLAKVTLTVAEINEKILYVWHFYDQKTNEPAGKADAKSKDKQ